MDHQNQKISQKMKRLARQSSFQTRFSRFGAASVSHFCRAAAINACSIFSLGSPRGCQACFQDGYMHLSPARSRIDGS